MSRAELSALSDQASRDRARIEALTVERDELRARLAVCEQALPGPRLPADEGASR